MESNTSATCFSDVARRYCDWAEGPAGDPDEEMRIARFLLAELHLAVLSLPDEMSDQERQTTPYLRRVEESI